MTYLLLSVINRVRSQVCGPSTRRPTSHTELLGKLRSVSIAAATPSTNDPTWHLPTLPTLQSSDLVNRAI